MKKSKLQIFNFFLLFFFQISYFYFSPGYAQTANYHFTAYTPVNGIASSDISTLHQDTKNYLWIGHAAGISRYDGYHFNNFLFANEHRLGRVYAICEDKDQVIWIGSETGLFLIKNNELVNISLEENNLLILSLSFDNKNGLWIGTNKGPNYITATELQLAKEKKQHKLGRTILEKWLKFSSEVSSVKFINTTEDGSIYLSDGFSVFQYLNNNFICRYQSINSKDRVTGLIGWNKDTAYISFLLSGFSQLNAITLNTYNFSDGIGNSLCLIKGELFYYASEGVYLFNSIKNEGEKVVSLPEEYKVWGSYVWQDNESNFWIGTHQELVHAQRSLFNIIRQPNLNGFNELYAIFKNPDGTLLLGGNRGSLFMGNKENTSFTLQKKVFPLAEVFDIYKYKNGDTWFCSGYEGLTLLKNNKARRFTTKDGLRNNSNFKFLETSLNELFVCGDNGISKITMIPEAEVLFKNYSFNSGNNIYTVVIGGVELSENNLFFGSNMGLLKLKNDSLHHCIIKNAIRNNISITDIKLDAHSNIWISTRGDGILICKENAEGSITLQKQLTEKDGLSSMIYLQLLIDNENHIWATGNKAVTQIELMEGTQFSISNYGHSQGFLKDNFHSVRMVQDNMDIIWIATSSGLMSFDSESINKDTDYPTMQIESISFVGKSKKGIVYKNALLPSNLSIPYNFGSLVFSFTAIQFSNPAAIQYSYRLLGADSNWFNLGNEKSLRIQNLAPGNYKFQVKAKGSNNVWGNIATLSFTITTPFWMHWWFFGLLAMVPAGIILLFIKRREKRIKNIEAQKTEVEKLKKISFQYQLEIEQIVSYFASLISSQKKIDDLLWDVTKNCISKLGFEDCVIYLIDEQSNTLIQKAAWGPKTGEENKILNPIDIPLGKGIVGAIALMGQAEIVNNTKQDSRYLVDDIERLSEISVPIISDGNIIGVIDSENSKAHFYTGRHLQILTTIAALCADKINKIKAEEITRAKEIEVLQLNIDLASSQLTALRSQMNPHFIFNSLNSIGQLVASEQNKEGLEYLNKFAALLRLVLEESENNFISLKDEVKLLSLYLQIESLRFGSSFAYNINIDDMLDEEDTMVPSFIIHPIVENAIWHGLLHKKDNRRLIINFEKKNNEEIICTIKDNGIGVDAAMLMKRENLMESKQQSKGLALVKDRLKILSQQFHTSSSLLIEDQKENGNITGTKVTIHLPFIYDA